ncbi:hypothetical protein SCH01S_49_00230 [Sphingomonas changbaiensis NBRC 104936]|uniref:Conjugal transfer protein TraD n=1 Tax=Sphingomonas changbaiensis NBRC 104936 TaxID=1219043 RepID=A0A0E9MSQ9_9SPHN|nr:conjugal transfer protein TraD [Sphingomonas changbaiensis]GAO40609.1 hypothetical protein SCH01S_49_00230 [Sphingomonas changbaiensis NBRC 104936]
MRKPRDYDAELKALNERAAQIKSRRLQQLSELVIAAGADALPLETLAGALVAAAKEKDAATKEGWRKAGAAFFQQARRTPNRADPNRGAVSPDSSPTLPLAGGARAS